VLMGRGTSDEERSRARECPRGLADTVGPVVAPGDAPEDINRAGSDARVCGDEPEAADDLLGVRAPADVEEVGGLAAVILHQINGRHRESGAVHAAPHGAVELDEGEPRLARRYLRGRITTRVAQGR